MQVAEEEWREALEEASNADAWQRDSVVAAAEGAHKAALQSTEREKERVVEEAMRMVEEQKALQV